MILTLELTDTMPGNVIRLPSANRTGPCKREGVRVASIHYITQNDLSSRPTGGTKIRMARPTRIGFPGVRNRGIEKRLIFRSRLRVMYRRDPLATPFRYGVLRAHSEAVL
jgi:hypothetical protein